MKGAANQFRRRPTKGTNKIGVVDNFLLVAEPSVLNWIVEKLRARKVGTGWMRLRTRHVMQAHVDSWMGPISDQWLVFFRRLDALARVFVYDCTLFTDIIEGLRLTTRKETNLEVQLGRFLLLPKYVRPQDLLIPFPVTFL